MASRLSRRRWGFGPFVGLPRRVRCGASFAEQGAVNGHGEGSGSSSTAEREGKERADRAGPAWWCLGACARIPLRLPTSGPRAQWDTRDEGLVRGTRLSVGGTAGMVLGRARVRGKRGVGRNKINRPRRSSTSFFFSFMFYFLFFLFIHILNSNLNLNQIMGSTLESGVTLK